VAAPLKAPDRRETLASAAYRALEEMIVVTLELPPGAVVSEAEIAARLELGRTPVREAIQRLASDGLVEVLPRRGVRVTDVNVESQLALLEARRPLERTLARLAARRAQPQDRDELRACAAAIARAAGEGDLEYARASGAAFASRARVAGNPYLERWFRAAVALSRRFWFAYAARIPNRERVIQAHVELLLALAAGDERESVRLADAFVDELERAARGALDAPARA